MTAAPRASHASGSDIANEVTARTIAEQAAILRMHALQLIAAAADVADMARWRAGAQRVGRDITRHHRPYQRESPNRYTAAHY